LLEVYDGNCGIGEGADYFEWSATWEMAQQLQTGLALLI
jgi:hypothetical protein